MKYEKILAKWRINRLKDRRVRRGLIEMYKSVNGLDEINWERNSVVYTPKVGVITRSNWVNIRRVAFKSRIRNDFVKQVSAINHYFLNRLKIDQAPTLNMFKKGLNVRLKSSSSYS